MADKISTMITNQKVKDTVAKAQAMQESALSKIKELSSKINGITSGISNILSNAQNIVSNTVTGIAGSIMASVEAFANKVNNGIVTTLTDLSKKAGSVISNIVGKTGLGAIAQKLSYVVDTVNSTINSMSVFGKLGNIANMVGEFTSNQLSKLAAATGISKILNNSDILNAVSSVAGSFASVTAAAKSVVGAVLDMPGKLVSTVAGAVDGVVGGVVGGVLSKVTDSVSSLAKVPGIGDLNTLVQDVYDLYSTGRKVYDTVTGKDPSIVLGIAENLNNSFPNVQGILQAASTICKSINVKNIQNYSANKDLTDLILARMASTGLYGSMMDFFNCTETQQYIDDSTYTTLSRKFDTTANNGDAHTASAIQKSVGSNRIKKPVKNMKKLSTTINDKDDKARSKYKDLLTDLDISPEQIVGVVYTDKKGKKMYAYSASDVGNLFNNSPNLCRDIVGNSTVGDIAAAIVAIA